MAEEGLPRLDEKKPWRVLKFYSGIGGMRYSLMASKVVAEVVEAFGINDSANNVYQHNFKHRPYQGNIQSLTAADLGIMQMLGFFLLHVNLILDKTSDTHMEMIDTLQKSDYVTQEFILSPLQFGVPYSRPRYFCLAKRKPFCFQSQSNNNKLLWSPVPFVWRDDQVEFGKYHAEEGLDNLVQFCEPVEKFLELAVQIDGEPSGFDDSENGSKHCSGQKTILSQTLYIDI